MKETTIAVLPRPAHLVLGAGTFTLDGESVIRAAAAPDTGRLLAAWLEEESGLRLEVETGDGGPGPAPNVIELSLGGNGGEEGYHLDVAEERISIRAATAAGLFYGCQSLRQLLPPDGARPTIPALTIEDRPRFRWRGLHLDVARHLFPVSFIKRYLDLMAQHKLNVFHWHLTDDQGWRIEIERYPELTEVGAWRASTPIPAARTESDGRPYGGFYSQDQIREVVEFARTRHITVVPEIEMPGHALAALAAYPGLGCRGGPYHVWPRWGIADDVFCAGNEETFTLLRDVLTEVMALFPGRVIHIGGDECPKSRWKACPRCQARIRVQGLRNEDELQSDFLRRIAAFLEDHGRRVMGWDEILDGDLPPDAMVMSWRGTRGGIAAAARGHDVVMTPTSHCYFDYYQSENQAAEPPAIGGLLTLEKVLSFDPLDGVPDDARHHVLGGQGNVWTEYIPTPEQVEYMAYPRAVALAEALWTAGTPSYGEFLRRLRPHLRRLNRQQVNYRPLDA